MKSDSPTETPAKTLERHAPPHSPGNQTRRVVDISGLALFHVAIVGVAAWSIRNPWVAVFAGMIVVGDISFFFNPPKRRPKLDPLPGADDPAQAASIGSFALELFVLLAPPLLFVAWLQVLIWQHQTLSAIGLSAIVIAIPAFAALATWIIKVRTTQDIAREGANQNSKFIASVMLGTWIGSTFFFVVFLVALLMKLLEP